MLPSFIKEETWTPLFKTRQNQEVHLELSDFKAHFLKTLSNLILIFGSVKINPLPRSPRNLAQRAPVLSSLPFPTPFPQR